MKECIYFRELEVGRSAKLGMKKRRDVFRIRLIKKSPVITENLKF